MNSIVIIVVAAALGGAAGLLYFGGLWYTARRALRGGYPVAVMLASFLGRTAIAFALFAGVMHFGKIAGLIAALAGFIAARWALVRHFGPQTPSGSGRIREHHA